MGKNLCLIANINIMHPALLEPMVLLGPGGAQTPNGPQMARVDTIKNLLRLAK